MPNTGTSEVEQRRVELRGTVGVHAGRAAGQHDRRGFLGHDLLDGRGVRDDLGVHPRLAHPPGDQLRVLRAEVDDEDGSGLLGLRHPNSLSGRARPSGRGRSGPT